MSPSPGIYLQNLVGTPPGFLFPIYSPNIESIVLNKTGHVRRAKLFYQRSRGAHICDF